MDRWCYYAIEAARARRDKPRVAADAARRLQPDLPETHQALGVVCYYIERDYDRALKELATARAGSPTTRRFCARSRRFSAGRGSGMMRPRPTRRQCPSIRKT